MRVCTRAAVCGRENEGKGRVSTGGRGGYVAISVFKNAHYTSLSKQLLRARACPHTRLATLQEWAGTSCMWPYWRLLGEQGASDACHGAAADTAAVMKEDFKGALWH